MPSAFCRPAGCSAASELEAASRIWTGFQPSSATRRIDRREFRGREVDKDVGARSPELGDLRVDRGIRHLVRRLGHDRQLAAKAIFQALDRIVTESVVLEK